MQNIIPNKRFFLFLLITLGIFWTTDIKAETYIDARWVGEPLGNPSCESIGTVFKQIDSSNCSAKDPGGIYYLTDGKITSQAPETGTPFVVKKPYVCCGSNTNVSGTSSETDILTTPKLEKIKTVFTPQAPIPGINYGAGIAEFVSSIYSWGIGIVGILALVQLIRGGFIYMISGAVDKKSEAKSIITDAFIGLALALGSYLIIYIINPAVLTIKFPEAPPKTDISGGLPSTASSTPEAPIEGATEGLIRKCMIHEELQGYMDYDRYKCIVDPEKAGTCPIGEGAFICTLPGTAVPTPLPPENATEYLPTKPTPLYSPINPPLESPFTTPTQYPHSQ